MESYHASHNYRVELEPKFYSDVTSFQVTLYNLNYGQATEKTTASDENQLFGEQKAVVSEGNQLFETLLLELNAKATTKETILKLYQK